MQICRSTMLIPKRETDNGLDHLSVYDGDTNTRLAKSNDGDSNSWLSVNFQGLIFVSPPNNKEVLITWSSLLSFIKKVLNENKNK